MIPAATAEETLRLREEEPPLGLDETEVICPACRLAQHEGGFSWGVCRDCLTEALDAFAETYVPPA